MPLYPLPSHDEKMKMPLQTFCPFNVAHRDSNGELPEETAHSYLFTALLDTTRKKANLNIFKSSELGLDSVSLLSRLMILLRSAARITHKAQGVTCMAAKWHMCATIDIFESPEVDIENPTAGGVFGNSSNGNGLPFEPLSSYFDDVGALKKRTFPSERGS
ncbi:unnamed protein product [Lactuca saligna]|uniref:Uncharacterized protein n=1 Tax=Lactuca saligna TaxID=75948 RepID=A0AA36DYL9_LACSI|nr:unnamed protein product [Lactuca saligna]